jgi:replicative DNA helicase
MYPDKIPPQAIEIEQSILGTVLSFNDSIQQVAPILTAEMFYNEANRNIYRAILELKDNPIDTLTVIEMLRKNGKIQDVGGVGYVVGLSKKVLSAANIEYHANIILQKYIHRLLIENNIKQSARVWDDGLEITSELGQMQTDNENILDLINGMRNKEKTLQGLILSSVNDYYLRKGRENFNKYATQIKDLDKFLIIEPGDLVVLAARPGMGKSAIMLQMCRNFAKNGVNPMIFSLEMTAEKLTNRILIAESQVDSFRFRTGTLTPDEEQKLNKVIPVVENLNITFDDKPGQTLFEIESKVLKMKPDIVFIDYMGLMKLPDSDSRNNELGAVSRGLKGLAKKMNIPIIALHQLSRKVEGRGIKIPMMSDLRDSGEIEQDADIIVFLYREDYYRKDERDFIKTNKLEVIISKYREGEPTNILLNHDYQLSNFYGQNDYFENQIDF